MTRSLIPILLAGLLGTAQAQSFTYRGSLEDGGEPAQGRYHLRLSLYADRIGNEALSVPLELNDVAVTDGRFAVGLDFPDLPPGLATGWLEVAVTADDDQWVTLDGRTEVGLNNVICPTPWGLEGNAGTNAAINFLGTTDDSALEVRVNNERILRLEPPRQLQDFFGVNIVGGSAANEVGSNAVFATIAGGGGIGIFGNSLPNRALGIGDFIGGGGGNTTGTGTGPIGEGSFAVVVGGLSNQATAFSSFMGGGNQNRATGEESIVVGGSGNRAEERATVVVGGNGNEATGEFSFIGGGSSNRSFGAESVIVGGFANTTRGFESMVAGGSGNCAGGDLSWAGGNRAKVRPGNTDFPEPTGGACRNVPQTGNTFGDRGTFVWADSQNTDFVSTGENQFLVRASGGMGLGTNAPQAHLHVDGPLTSNGLRIDLNGSPRLLVASNGGTTIGGNSTPPPNGLYITGVLRTNLSSSGNTTVCRNASFELGTCSSSIRYKQHIQSMEGEEALRLLQQLRPVRYQWIDGGRADIGLIAEEVAGILPDIITYGQDGQIEGLEYNRLGPLLVAGLQQQQAFNQSRFAALESELRQISDEYAQLAAENAELRTEIIRLKTQPGQMRELAERNALLESSNAALADRLAALERAQAEELDILRTELALLREMLLPAVAGMQ